MTDHEGDLNLTCVNCTTIFVWTVGEQQFFRERDLQQPRRCKACARARREALHGTGSPPRSNDWRRAEQR